MTDQKHPAGSFKVIRLSRIAQNAMEELENAAMEVEAARSFAAIQCAYLHINHAREQLALHVANLEYAVRLHGAQGISPTITVRYE